VQISGNEIVYDVKKNSGTETKILALTGLSITVFPELSYVKNLTYVDKETIITADNWKDAGVEFTLRYPNKSGSTALVPTGTPIRLTYMNVQNQTVYVESTVKSSGKVEFTIKAPSVIDGGRQVQITSTAQLPYTQTVSGNEITGDKIFTISPVITATLYGDMRITLDNRTMIGPY
jgi:hypothetical protein